MGGGGDGRGQRRGVVERDGEMGEWGGGRDGWGQRKDVVERDGGGWVGRDGRGQRKNVVEREVYWETGGKRERENSNSKTLFYKDCSLGSVKEREREKRTVAGALPCY